MATSTGAGRPRDPAIDERVLLATRELLVEAGWQGTSVRGIAERAGVSRPAILRRWPSKAHLVSEALLGPEPDMAAFAHVGVDGWIDGVADGALALFDRPEFRSAVPAMLAIVRDDPELRRAMWRGFTGPAVDLAGDLVGQERRADAAAAIAVVAGAALFSSTVVDDPVVRDRIRSLLRSVCADALGLDRRGTVEPERSAS